MNQTVLNNEFYSVYLKDSNERSFNRGLNKGFITGVILGFVSFLTTVFLFEMLKATSNPAL